MRGHDPNQAPTPQQIAAYFDGELDAVVRQRVADWLAEHPNAAAELDAQRSLPQTCQSAAPPEPSEAEWSSVLERINERTQTIKAKQRGRLGWPPRRFFSLRLAFGAAVAAAVLVGLLLHQPEPPPEAPEPVKVVENQQPVPPPAPSPQVAVVLPVLADADVEIISMDAGDAHAVVVGSTPLPRRFDLAGTGEIVVHKVIALDGTEVMKPSRMNMDDSAGVPMMWPLALATKP